MLSGRSRRLPPLARTRVTITRPATATATATVGAPAATARRPGSPLRTHIHPFPVALRRAAPDPRRPRLRALHAAPAAAGARRPLQAGLRFALRALIPPALLVVILVVPPQSLRATLVTLLIIAALGLLVWRLPMADEE